MNLWIIILMIAIGILSGFATGVIGASGVMVVVSLLKLMGVPMYIALGVSLGIDTMVSLTTTFIYHRHGNVNLKDGRWMLVAALLGVQVGVRIVRQTPEATLQGIFALSLCVSGGFLLRGGGLKDVRATRDTLFERLHLPLFHQMNRKRQQLTSLGVGFIIGILCGFQGAGGGLMFFAALIFIFDYPLHEAVGTSTLMMLFTAASGMIAFAMIGAINWHVVMIIGTVALITNLITAKFANRLPERKLEKTGGSIFVLLGVLLGVLLLYQPPFPML